MSDYYGSPSREHDVIDEFTFRRKAKFEFLIVHEEISVSVVEFRDEFLEVRVEIQCGLPGAFDAAEDTIGWSKHTVLQFNHELWYLSNQEVHHEPGRAVMRRIQVSLGTLILFLENIGVEVLELI